MYLDELVGMTITGVCAAQDAAQFLVEERVAARPVDVAMGIGEVERQELREACSMASFQGLSKRSAESGRSDESARSGSAVESLMFMG